MNALHIKHWDALYENNDTRKLANLTWYPKRTKLVGEGIGLTLAQTDNTQLLGTWALIETLAATSVKAHRGYLVRNGSALTAARMHALIPSVAGPSFQRAIDWFLLPEVDWLEWRNVPGTSPENPPPKTGNQPSGGKLPGTSPENPPPEGIEGAEGIEGIEEKGKKREGAEARSSSSLPIPSETEVRDWAAAHQVDPDYAEEKVAQAVERNDFAKATWQRNWRSKLARFWKTDRAAWQKNRAPKNSRASERPDDWQAGDRDWWWTDPVDALRAALFGQVSSGNEKAAARLREILAVRQPKGGAA